VTGTELLVVVGPSVALLATFVTWLGHRVLRANAELAAKISRDNAVLSVALESAKQLASNRQVWIDNLRDDLAVYFSLTLESDYKKIDYQKIYEVGARTELRMNPADPDYQELRTAMSECMEKKDLTKIKDGRELYISVSQRILKREWDVLKGELRALAEKQAHE
jgi:hypothetical protein